jgi:hypothetical protein
LKRAARAWLITWEWFGDHVAVDDPYIGTIDGRIGQQVVLRLIECLYLLKNASRREQTEIAMTGDLPYRAAVTRGHITCGDNPFILARRVPLAKM